MTWNFGVSDKRVQEHLDGMGEIEVKPYTREMDLDNLSETRCRRIFGAHIYAEIRNLSSLVSTRTSKTERQELIQATHLYQREVSRIAKAVGAERIHFQGGRAHFLIHHPIEDDKGIATKAALLQLVLDRFGVVFDEEFPDLEDVEIRSGADMGFAIGTRNGTQGDRELLFIGAPANHAAKLLVPDTAKRRLTAVIADVLPDDLSLYVLPDGDTHKLARPTVAQLAELLDAHSIVWSVEKCRERLAADRVTYPADKAAIWGTDFRIEFDVLSYTDSKLADAATLYADVSGFTAFVDAATTEDAQRRALRAFHAIRKELATVVVKDFGGVRVQFQGDRVQGLFHLPRDNAAEISEKATRAAVGLQSSFEQVLKTRLPEIADMGLAVGISRGETIAARLGEYAHRDRICLGEDVLRAERNEERVGEFEIGISANVWGNLTETLAEQFVFDPAKKCHVATGLDQDKLDAAEDAKALAKGSPVYLATGGVISTVVGTGRPVKPAASFGYED